MSKVYDAIVIGAGHNGLVAAAMLARKGLKTIVLEGREHSGGLLGDAAFRIAHLPFGLHPQVSKALGIELATKPVETLIANPNAQTIRVTGKTVTGVSPQEATHFAQMHTRLVRQAQALSGMIANPPPAFEGNNWAQLLSLGKTALKLRRLGKNELRDLMRIALSNVWDLATDELGDGPLAGMLAMDATIGGAMGPRSPGTVLPLLWRMATSTEFGNGMRLMPENGPQALVEALAAALSRAGGDMRLGTAVARILVENDKVVGVRLQSGEEIRASRILSSAAPATTLLDLLGVEHLDGEFVRRCRTMANTGMVARIDFELKDVPSTHDDTRLGAFQRLLVAPDMMCLEKAFNAAKYGGIPDQPPLEAHFDALQGRLQVTVQFVPGKVDWTQTMRKALEKAVVKMLSTAMPEIGSLIRSARTMTPADIGKQYSLPGGHWHHAEFRIDQLLMLRPFDGAAQYRMPVKGLYLCGAACHPGGDINGSPGFNAANAALADGRL
ncbi:MAG: NAD(P)/FAD-dependent oxidoreductase [Nitratireductor sp.]